MNTTTFRRFKTSFLLIVILTTLLPLTKLQSNEKYEKIVNSDKAYISCQKYCDLFKILTWFSSKNFRVETRYFFYECLERGRDSNTLNPTLPGNVEWFALLLLHSRGIPGSNHGLGSCYIDSNYLWVSAVRPSNPVIVPASTHKVHSVTICPIHY